MYDFNIVADFLVDIHRHQPGLVKAGLELVGHQHDAVLRAIKGQAQILPFHVRVHAFLGEFLAFIDNEHIVLELLVIRVHHLLAGQLAREGNQRTDMAVFGMLFDVAVKRLLVADRSGSGSGDDHRLGLAIQTVRHVLAEVQEDELHLLRDVGRV